MKFFVDTADIKEIEELIPTGFVDGVTTNPSLIAKNGDDYEAWYNPAPIAGKNNNEARGKNSTSDSRGNRNQKHRKKK